MRYAVTSILLASAVPGAAQVTDPLAMTMDPADRAVMADAAAAVASRNPDLRLLDAVLTRLPRPTPLRGLVQTVRAGVLAASQDPGPAVSAVEDALRLLPDDPRPKLVAAMIFTFGGSPQRAADLWMAASQESPDFARMSDRYLMSALVGRLIDLGDHVRADRVTGRLGEIGFSAGLAPERSQSALARTRIAVRSKRDDEALSGIAAVGNPDDLLSLYVDKRYAMLWPRITEWTGSDLATQSRRYLEELRGDWTAADDYTTAAPYAKRLANLGAHAAVIQLFQPMFDRLRPGVTEDDAERLAPIVARSLETLGRDIEARSLLAKVAGVMRADDSGNALNIDGGYVTLATIRLDWPQVIARADTFWRERGRWATA